MFRCVRITPFGRPVEPEVYCRIAGASGLNGPTAKPAPVTAAFSPGSGLVVLERAGKPLGVGTILNSDGRILTALSILGDGRSVDVRYADGGRAPARIGHADRARDLALVVPQSGWHKQGLKASNGAPSGALRAFELFADLAPYVHPQSATFKESTIVEAMARGEIVLHLNWPFAMSLYAAQGLAPGTLRSAPLPEGPAIRMLWPYAGTETIVPFGCRPMGTR